MAGPIFGAATSTTGTSTWAAPISTKPAVAEHMQDSEVQPLAHQPLVAPESFSGAPLLTVPAVNQTPGFESGPVLAFVPELPLRSGDGRVVLTDTTLTVRGQAFLLRELERAELTPVRWILWYLLGGMGLAAVMIAFLQNWLHTGPAMLGMALTALLLAYGHRGTNRLRLHRLGHEMVNFALPGETPPWQRLTAEVNRRIYRVHDQAARETAALLAAADEATRQAAQAAAETGLDLNSNPLTVS